MRIAIICLDGKAPPNALEDIWRQDLDREYASLEKLYATIIARHMRDGGKLAPVIVCDRNSSLEAMARDLNLPTLPVGGPIAGYARFWRWQRKFPALMLLAIGSKSLRFTRSALRMRGKRTTVPCAAFLLRAPTAGMEGSLALLRHCICGSSFIADKIGSALDKVSAKKIAKHQPELTISPPCLDLEAYKTPAQPFISENGAHFVFGMSSSLLPRSGALQVVRAMGSMWLREELPPWEVRMFGTGPRYQEILSGAQNLGVASRLSILADQPLPYSASMCHAWLAPGTDDNELPETLWCGFASGLPVICSHSPLHRERMQIFPANAALRVDNANPQELARAMIGVMRDHRLRQRLVASAASERQAIGLEAMARRIGDLLESWMPREAGA